MRLWIFIISLGLLFSSSLFHLLMLDPWMNMKAEASSLPTMVQLTVQPGDSIWSIATRYNNNNHLSVRDMVDLIIEENHLTKTTLQIGQVLIIPTHK
ncbi:MAG TPA: LysM peptidoglycan-binding domain-containing protein [Bacillota bacterium]|nr:LysM peptidoglycan-binding domain-containing protein [Bacillota bacterium]